MKLDGVEDNNFELRPYAWPNHGSGTLEPHQPSIGEVSCEDISSLALPFTLAIEHCYLTYSTEKFDKYPFLGYCPFAWLEPDHIS
jgi:hypothetical protein